MKITVLLISLLLAVITAAAQRQPVPTKHRAGARSSGKPGISRRIEHAATFRGDAAGYLRNKLRYPDEARELGAEGTAEVVFEVDKEGAVHFLMFRKSSGVDCLDAEARRVVSAMPAWNPRKKNGVAVRSLMLLPVVFRLIDS